MILSYRINSKKISS